jgi:hypothetical protein
MSYRRLFFWKSLWVFLVLAANVLGLSKVARADGGKLVWPGWFDQVLYQADESNPYPGDMYLFDAPGRTVNTSWIYPYAIAHAKDSQSGKEQIYFQTSEIGTSIQRVDVDDLAGATTKEIRTGDNFICTAMAIDPVNRFIYCLDNTAKNVLRFSQDDGSGLVTLIQNIPDYVTAMDLDTKQDKIFFSATRPGAGLIYSANLDGSNLALLYTQNTPGSELGGFSDLKISNSGLAYVLMGGPLGLLSSFDTNSPNVVLTPVTAFPDNVYPYAIALDDSDKKIFVTGFTNPESVSNETCNFFTVGYDGLNLDSIASVRVTGTFSYTPDGWGQCALRSPLYIDGAAANNSNTSSTPTATPTATPTSTPTATPTPAPTAAPTSVPTALPTATPTATPSPIPTATPTATPTPVPTPVLGVTVAAKETSNTAKQSVVTATVKLKGKADVGVRASLVCNGSAVGEAVTNKSGIAAVTFHPVKGTKESCVFSAAGHLSNSVNFTSK